MAGQLPATQGYPGLAGLMGPFAGMAIYKRFAVLNAHSLLLQQAELLDLEFELQAQAAIDRDNNLDYDKCALNMIRARENGESGHQWQLWLQARAKLKEYNAALLQQAQLAQLTSPRSHDLGILRCWLGRKSGGNDFLPPVEAQPWLPQNQTDSVALSTRQHDSITNWLAEKVVPWLFHHNLARKTPIAGQEELGLVQWDDAVYDATSKVAGVIASCFLPTVAIVTLSFVENLITRIIVAMAFSLCFSIALATLTNARVAEIFASTAAFAAVEVVFIGSTDTSLTHKH